MKHPALPTEFYYDLVSFLLNAKQHIVSMAGEFGLTGIQALTLLTIKQPHERSMGDYCRLYNCDASNITGIVDGLEQKQLVSRQPHPADRRIKIIHLEPAGAELQKRLITRIAEISPLLFGNLSHEEIKQLASLIQKTQRPK